MKVSLRWLADHLDLTEKSIDEMADLLTFAGIEVEGIEVMPQHLVVGRIESSDPHPDATKLSVCQVNDGTDEPRQVVCGAKNYQVGDHVPLALPGCNLGDGFVIKESTLRGVASHGMLCAAEEIGLASEEDGLLILSKSTNPGTSLSDLYPPVFDLEITPNRPDLLSHLGLARELAALLEISLSGKPIRDEIQAPTRAAETREVLLDHTDACPFYSARKITGVTIKPSPTWLQEKLSAIGLRPINNVVDITNFVLFEMGQPLHAFDSAKLSGPLHIRAAKAGESFSALDGESYSLEDGDCVIADEEKAHALAGIVGGLESGVTEKTTDLILEAAYFSPSRVRRTSHRVGLHSDSSYRFERGVDPAQILGASELATALIVELAGGTPEEEILAAGTLPSTDRVVKLDPKKCNKLIGADLPTKEIDGILKRLGLAKTKAGWAIPSYRGDLERPVDLIEEVARVVGLDRVPSKRGGIVVSPSKADADFDFRRKVGTHLAHAGLFECQTIKLVSEGQLADDLVSQHRALTPLPVRNPMTDTHSYLRPALLPSLLRIADHNVRMGAPSLAFFEMGTIFVQTPKGDAVEQANLAILLGGPQRESSWTDSDPPVHDLHSLRGLLESLIGHPLTLKPIEDDRVLLPTELLVGKTKIGLIGQVHPARTRQFDFPHPVLVAEIPLKKLASL
ncbi:MAG: phenylalanine--tRNA ligase subunit beta, partial [Verrucomicrobiota bacterium]